MSCWEECLLVNATDMMPRYLLWGGVRDRADTAGGGTGGNMSWCGWNIRGGGGASVSGSSGSCLCGDLPRASRTALRPPGDRLMDRFSGVSDSPERLLGRACLRRGWGLCGLAGGDAAAVPVGGLPTGDLSDSPHSAASWSARPRTCSDSPARITVSSCSCATETSPRYMKSTTACTSHPWKSLSTITGCLHGFSLNILLKSGLHAPNSTLWARTLLSAHTRVTSTSVSACSSASKERSRCAWWLFQRRL